MRRWHSAAHARGAAASRGTGQMLGLIVFFIVTGRVGILEGFDTHTRTQQARLILEGLGSSGLRFCTLPARWLGQGDEATNKAGLGFEPHPCWVLQGFNHHDSDEQSRPRF